MAVLVFTGYLDEVLHGEMQLSIILSRLQFSADVAFHSVVMFGLHVESIYMLAPTRSVCFKRKGQTSNHEERDTISCV
jgi:hypothetical protein